MIDFGTLHLPDAEPAALQASEWTDWPLHGWMLVVSALILLLILPEIYKLLPAMAGCLTRSRGNLEVEHSISVARSRGNIARILALIFVVVADRYRIYDPSFIADWDEPWLRFAELAGVLAAFLLLRYLVHAILLSLGRKHLHPESRAAVQHGLYNYFICFILTLLPSVCLLSIFNPDDILMRQLIWAELALFWLVALVREGQILQSNYGGFLNFLYLCGLEIIPAGALVASGLVF